MDTKNQSWFETAESKNRDIISLLLILLRPETKF